MLWRRETKQVDSGRSYVHPEKPGPDSVLVKTIRQSDKTILYTDFHETGKLSKPTAERACHSGCGHAKNANVPEGQNGITYLINAKKAGIVTPLMDAYEQEILRTAGATTLAESLLKAQDCGY